MFIGHAALALAAKPLAPRAHLGVALAATYWLDLVWPVLVLVGIKRVEIDPGNTAFTPLDFVHYPWSHSLVAALAWGALFGLACWRLGRRAALDGPARLQPLGAGRDLAPARSAAVARQRDDGRAGVVGFRGCDTRRGKRAVCRGRSHLRAHCRSCRPRLLGARRLLRARLSRRGLRPATAERAGGSLERGRAHAAAGVGLVARAPQSNGDCPI